MLTRPFFLFFFLILLISVNDIDCIDLYFFQKRKKKKKWKKMLPSTLDKKIHLDSWDFLYAISGSVNSLYWAVFPHLSTALSKFKCLAAKHSCLNPLWTYFLVTYPRMDPNGGITARGCAWMSPEETVVVFAQCFKLM